MTDVKEFQGCYLIPGGRLHEYVYIGTEEGHKLMREEHKRLYEESQKGPWNTNI